MSTVQSYLDAIAKRNGKVAGRARQANRLHDRLQPAALARLGEFVTVLDNGIPVSDDARDDVAAIVYRNWLQRMVGKSRERDELDRYYRGQSALRKFLDREPAKRVSPTQSDLFPLPIDWEPVAPAR